MKTWLKVLFVLWFILSVWYYLCQINSHCATTLHSREAKTKTIFPKEKATKTALTKEKQLTQKTQQDSALEVPSKAQEIEERLTTIEQSYSSTSIFSFNPNETKVTIKVKRDNLVNDLIFYFKHRPNSKIKLIGHTDNYGTNALNYRLGKWRAKNAKDRLVQLGIARKNMIIASKGETSPIADNQSAEGRKENRRVEIQFIH